jgi:ABC-type multidrug transport system fused ATPase/permease subunit
MAFCGVQTAGSFGLIFENIKSADVIKAAHASGAFWAPVRRLLLLFSAQFSLNFIASNLLARATNQLGKRLRLSYYASVLQQETAFFDAHKSGELLQHLGEDIGAICTASRQVFTTGLRSAFDIALGGAMMWRVSSDLTFALFTVMPLMAGSGHVMGTLLRAQSKRVSMAAGHATAVAGEDVVNIRTVKAFVSEDRELQRYDLALTEAVQAKTTMALATGTFFGALHFGINLTQLAICFYGGHLISQGGLSSGGMVSIVSQSMRLQHAFAGLSRTYSNLVKAVSTCEGVFEVVQRSPPEWSDASDGRRYLLYGAGGDICPSTLRGHIMFDGVTFAYPTRPGHRVLNNLTLDIEPGTVCALVGPSGSGKSTVGALLEKFYSPDLSHGGGITLDGRRLGTIDTQWLRANVGLVDQSPALFATSVLENIRYGKPDATAAQVVEAAKAANAHSFIVEFPDGYDTDLGERGAALSGGQRQRIAIARALLKNPRILILDEATSALDSESEHVVQEALDRLMQGRTTLVIAHRLSTIVGADKICVLENGRLAEMGTHAQLLKKAGGKYAALFRRQQEMA